ncbi:hypothetical protein ACNKHV_24595 [Shigella flexneri]
MRQLENTCRWLTVMAAGQEVLIQDLPGELSESTVGEYSQCNRTVGRRFLRSGQTERWFRSSKSCFSENAARRLERTLLTTALRLRRGINRKQQATRLGRNALTRKLKELGME